MRTNNAHYGYFDISDTINSCRTRQKRIIGNEPRILKDPDYRYAGFRMSGRSKVYDKKNKLSFDNCRDIFKEIDLLKKDIERYRSIGIEVIKRDGCPDFEINWYKIANRVERELDNLYNLL